jgi:hypothetical protein
MIFDVILILAGFVLINLGVISAVVMTGGITEYLFLAGGSAFMFELGLSLANWS